MTGAGLDQVNVVVPDMDAMESTSTSAVRLSPPCGTSAGRAERASFSASALCRGHRSRRERGRSDELRRPGAPQRLTASPRQVTSRMPA